MYRRPLIYSRGHGVKGVDTFPQECHEGFPKCQIRSRTYSSRLVCQSPTDNNPSVITSVTKTQTEGTPDALPLPPPVTSQGHTEQRRCWRHRSSADRDSGIRLQTT